jgi:hypothetical protein
MAKGFIAEPLQIDLAPGAVVERIVELESGFQISGRCVDEQGLPIAVQFTISPLPTAGELPLQLKQESQRLTQGGRRADGTFELSVSPGVWLLQPEEWNDGGARASPPRMGHNLVVDVRSGPVTDLVIPLLPPGCAVVSWLGSEREELRLRFLDEAGLVRSVGHFWGASPQRQYLPPGRWILRVMDAQGQVRDEMGPFTLDTEPLALELGRDR